MNHLASWGKALEGKCLISCRNEILNSLCIKTLSPKHQEKVSSVDAWIDG